MTLICAESVIFARCVITFEVKIAIFGRTISQLRWRSNGDRVFNEKKVQNIYLCNSIYRKAMTSYVLQNKTQLYI